MTFPRLLMLTCGLLLTACSSLGLEPVTLTPPLPTITPSPTPTIVWFPATATPTPQQIRTQTPTPEMRTGLGIVIATDGAREIFALNSDGDAFTVQPPPLTAVDATGAGDAFRAGLLAGLLNGEPFPRALCWGAAAGALSVRHPGAATLLPPPEEIIALAGTLDAQTVS